MKIGTTFGASGPKELDYLTYVLYAVLALTVASLLASQGKGLLAAVGIGGQIFLAALSSGAVLGFIFAVPRLLMSDGSSLNATKNTQQPRLQSNTNLERISDWLTTMLVGVGLSQLHKLNDALFDFRMYIQETATVFNGSAGALPAIAPLLLITGVITGFITMYLHTRLVLASGFAKIEEELNRPLEGGLKRTVLREARAADDGSSALSRSIAESPEPTLNDALDLMFDLLYKPDGYERVLTIGDELKNTVATRNPSYWFYLAAANGQRLTARRERGASKADIEAATKDALEAARRAVQLDSDYARRLWFISNPESSDNDLQELRKNATFLKLVKPYGEKAP